jgi:hypothetical protein
MGTGRGAVTLADRFSTDLKIYIARVPRRVGKNFTVGRSEPAGPQQVTTRKSD